MADTNGGGRMDRIEAALDKLAERQREFTIIQERDHEEHQRDYKQLMTWQVLTQDKMEADRIEHLVRQKQLDEGLTSWSSPSAILSSAREKPPAGS